jgi:hypothetical protein
MHVCIHRGSNQIGRNCIEVISQGKRIRHDPGLPRVATENKQKYFSIVSDLDANTLSLLTSLHPHPQLQRFGLKKIYMKLIKGIFLSKYQSYAKIFCKSIFN